MKQWLKWTGNNSRDGKIAGCGVYRLSIMDYNQEMISRINRCRQNCYINSANWKTSDKKKLKKQSVFP